MKTLLSTQFGSHIYGTNTPSSDLDFKEIFIPDAKDILLQRAPRTIVTGTKTDKNARNTSEDVDIEQFSLHQYLKLLMEGQTVALDMLFTPDTFHKGHTEVWRYIQESKDRFLHRGTTAFVGYARQQASKYGIKGTRVAAMRLTLECLNAQDDWKKLNHADVHYALYHLIYSDPANKQGVKNEYIDFVDCKGPHGQPEPHLQVCGRKVPLHATVKYARGVFQKIFDEYGARALLAERNEGVDWKALMHAVRVANQAKELLTTGLIVFPRPEAAMLLQIRKGEMPYKQVAELVENGLEELERVKEHSILRAEPDREFADKLIEEVYSRHIVDEYGWEGA
jgi:hypothetical protein